MTKPTSKGSAAWKALVAEVENLQSEPEFAHRDLSTALESLNDVKGLVRYVDALEGELLGLRDINQRQALQASSARVVMAEADDAMRRDRAARGMSPDPDQDGA